MGDTATTLAEALEQEHRDIDAGFGAFLEGLEQGQTRVAELNRAVAALRRHIWLEEEFLFPPLREAGLFAAVLVMLREHGEIWRMMDQLTGKVDGDRAAALCRELLGQLEPHNDKEEAIIYPAGDTQLDEEQRQRLQNFLSSGTLPAGWICQMA